MAEIEIAGAKIKGSKFFSFICCTQYWIFGQVLNFQRLHKYERYYCKYRYWASKC